LGATEGTFEILSGSERTLFETDGGVRVAHASGTQRFSGGIDGDGSIDWLMCYLPGGAARFVGLQRIDGAIGARRGSFVMEAVGAHDGTRSTATWRIIEGAGTGDLAGIRGRGVFNAPGGPTVSYRLEVEFGPPC
jgi:hypothetical protein